MLDDMLLAVGITLKLAFAGFCGGLVHAFVFVRTTPMAAVGSVVVGTMTANYLSPPAARMLGLDPAAAAFIVGLAGMAICQGLVAAAKAWRPVIPGGSNGGQDAKP